MASLERSLRKRLNVLLLPSKAHFFLKVVGLLQDETASVGRENADGLHCCKLQQLVQCDTFPGQVQRLHNSTFVPRVCASSCLLNQRFRVLVVPERLPLTLHAAVVDADLAEGGTPSSPQRRPAP